MNGRGIWCCLGCVALGAVGAVLYMKHKDKIKPIAAELVAKSMKLRDKALDYAAKTKEHAEDIVAGAKHLNEQSSQPGS